MKTVKKMICLFLCLFLINFKVQSAPSADSISIDAKSAILIEASTGKTLYERNPHEKLAPASVTKIMTMLLIMEAIEDGRVNMNDMVRTSENAAKMGGSQVYLEPGEEMSVTDMIKAIAVASGNDASVAMAEFVSGSEEAFVSDMNKRARELGMMNTNFINCNGLEANSHYTTAYDISLMSRELLKHKDIIPYLSIWMDSLRDGKFTLANTNKLIRHYPGANGLKTGFTDEAKYCLSASAIRENMQLIAVIMGSSNSNDRFAAATKMLDFGFANYTVKKGCVAGEELGEVLVAKGVKTTVKVVAENDFDVLAQKGAKGELEKRLELMNEVSAPVLKGQKAGELVFLSVGEEVARVDVCIAEDVKKMNFGDVYTRMLYSLFNVANDFH